MYDAAVLGTGPAGLSAALTLRQRDANFVWFGSPQLSGKVERSEKIANYPGAPMVTGPQLNALFRQQMAQLDLAPVDKVVTNIAPGRSGYMLLAENELWEARAVLLAVGAAAAKGPEGEQTFLGRGVSYCATCDGFLYRGKTIGLVLGAKRFEPEGQYLAQLAGRLYLYAAYPDCSLTGPNVTALERPIRQIYGQSRVEGVTLSDGAQLPLDGLFVLRESIAPANLLPGLRLDGPHIWVDRQCATNLPGVFAAGDCTGRPYQIATATGEGTTAAHSLLDYLAHHPA